MAFNLKNKLTSSGLSRKSSSPLNNNDLTGAANLANVDLNKANVTNTASVKDLSGKDFATERIITTPGKKVEKQASSNQAYLDSFSSEFSKAKEGGFEGTLPEYIKQKEKKAGYQGEEIKQKRDYDVENKPKYKIDKNTGKSYITLPIEGSKVRQREYHYPTYDTGHHEKGTLISENEMLGNLYEKFDSNKAKRIYEAWVKKNTGKDVTWSRGNYNRNNSSDGGVQNENKGNWQNIN